MTDKRVRHQAWHTIEDGGKPSTPEAIATLERICARETDPKVRRFAEFALDKALGPRKERELAELKTAHLRDIKPRGKCDFCGATNVPVGRDFETMIPNGDLPRVALICDPCASKIAQRRGSTGSLSSASTPNDALVDAAQRFLPHEPLQSLHAERELAQGQTALRAQAALAQALEVLPVRVYSGP